MKTLPAIIMENLSSDADPDYTFTEEDRAEILPKIEELVAEGGITWTLRDQTLELQFDAYDLMCFAFGPISCSISLKDYPDLIVEKYLPAEDGAADPEALAEHKEDKAQKFSLEELHAMYTSPGTGDDAGITVVHAPDWESFYYVRDDSIEDITEPPFTVTKVSEEALKSALSWADRHGFERPDSLVPAGDGNSDDYKVWDYDNGSYVFHADNYGPGDQMILEVSESVGWNAIGTYLFYDFQNTGITGSEDAKPYIRCADINGDTLYVEITQSYTDEDERTTGYMVAMDLYSGKVLWRTEAEIANADNFILGDDTIICGYQGDGVEGEETNCVNIISAKTGHFLQQIPLDDTPLTFFTADESFYVLTPSKAYEFLVASPN